MGRKQKSIVPDITDWKVSGDEFDHLEVDHLKGMFFGKNFTEVNQYFGEGRSIERAGELQRAPRRVFQYYIHAYERFLYSDDAKGDSDSASCFLSLLEAREKRDPGSVSEIYATLVAAVAFVSERQDYFEANIEIYGDFREAANRIAKNCSRLPRR